MPVNTIRKPEWGLLYYHFQGYCTSIETVKATQEATAEFPKGQLKAIFDLLDGELDIVAQQDIKQIMALNKQLFESGIINTQTAVITQSHTLEVFMNAFELLMTGAPTEIRTFPSLTNTLAWLGLAQHEQELIALLKNSQK